MGATRTIYGLVMDAGAEGVTQQVIFDKTGYSGATINPYVACLCDLGLIYSERRSKKGLGPSDIGRGIAVYRATSARIVGGR